MSALVEPSPELVDRLRQLRRDVREFLEDELRCGGFTPTVDSWMRSPDPAFSLRLAGAGFVGMTIPTEFEGHGRTSIERHVVAEELLAAGAPVAAHWIAERQMAPLLLRFGTAEQKQRLIPGIAKGRTPFCIGMSEPDAGSDLAAVRTRASATDDGWILEGRKVWTTNAHIARAIIVLARTDGQHGDRHRGLSQLVVELPTPGVTVHPILAFDGTHHFNEVIFEQVRLPRTALLGERGRGWAQVNAELSHERSGPERFLSMVPLLRAWESELGPDAGESERMALGRLVARLAALRRASFRLVWGLQNGADIARGAAAVKLQGNAFEQDVVTSIGALIGRIQEPSPVLADLMDQARVSAPAVTLRGGTTEILRTIVAKSFTGS